MLKEFWFGNPEERQAGETARRLKSIGNLNTRQQQQLNKADAISRRVFFRRAAAVGLFVAGAALPTCLNSIKEEESLKRQHGFNASGYENWRRYWEKQLPTSSVLSIADDLIAATEYPGFLEAGQLLKTATVNYQAIDQLNPPLSSPVKVSLKNMQAHGAVTAGFFIVTEGTGVKGTVTNKTTNQSIDATLAEASKNTADLELEQTMAFGSNAVKALLISKEISHLAYIPELKQRIYHQFNENFTLTTSTTMPVDDLLFNSAMLSERMNTSPRMSFEYRNAQVLLDWAGYWHVTQALGRMLRQNILSTDDKKLIAGNINAFNLAKDRGLLKEQKPGVFVWKEGVGPYSNEWIQVMKDAKSVPVLKDPRS